MRKTTLAKLMMMLAASSDDIAMRLSQAREVTSGMAILVYHSKDSEELDT